MSKTGNWKGAERGLAHVLNEFKIPAFRKCRGANFAVSDTDVEIPNHENYKLDSKYSKAMPFRHHGKFREIQSKYCKSKEDIPILFTKNYKEVGGLISIRDRLFGMLLSYWLGFSTKEELWKIYLNE